jgi:hypothetical protein
MKKTERKIKLLGCEVVECKSHYESFLVRELADALGLRWIDGTSLMANSYAGLPAYLDLHARAYLYFLPCDTTAISATQWLNRHEVFVPGQKVRLNNDTFVYWYIGSCPSAGNDYYWITNGDAATFWFKYQLTGCDSSGNPWPEWVDEPERVRIDWSTVKKYPGQGHSDYTPEEADEIVRQITEQRKMENPSCRN